MANVFGKFPAFCKALTINSKEYGNVPLSFWGTQKYFVEELARGVEDGIRHFTVLKGRQQGITTAGVAIVPYWLFQYPGIQGAFITDTDTNKSYFRMILSGYLKSLPRSMKVPVDSHNREILTFKNRSMLVYMTAGTRKRREGGDLGRAKGLNYLHATEVAAWADPDELQALVDSLAQIYVNRLYIFESTARGFNIFFDMWETAKRAKTQRAIFIGWWRKEIYQFAKDTQVYRVYWDGKLSTEEKQWVKEIKQLYGWEITGEQMAWWRWMLHEQKNGDLNNLYQEHPPTEEYAFVMSGYKFFNSQKLTEAFKYARRQEYSCLRYTFGSDFLDTRVHHTTSVNSELNVWERPVPNGVYVVGADPAYGYNEESDRSVASVFRCYADRLVQVAEFSASGVRTDQFAWVLLHLAGAYKNTMVNLELTGPGGAVFNELQNVKKRMNLLPKEYSVNIMDAISSMSHFLYSREDALQKSFAYHSKTGSQDKELMLNRMKDFWERGTLEVKSCDAINEAKYFARDGATLEGRGGENDDRVIAIALAVMAYNNFILAKMISAGMTYAVEKKKEEVGETTALGKQVMNFLAERGLVKK